MGKRAGLYTERRGVIRLPNDSLDRVYRTLRFLQASNHPSLRHLDDEAIAKSAALILLGGKVKT